MSTKFVGRWCLQFLALACLLALATWSFGQEIGTFTGGDPGEGLDLDGDIIYAIDMGNNDVPYVVNGVEFTHDEFTDGVEIFKTHAERPGTWAQPDFGDSASDDDLEGIMGTILWSQAPSAVEIDAEVTTGQAYKLQMLFTEGCCNRGFDIFVEDELIAEDFAIHEHHSDWDPDLQNFGPKDRDNAVVLTYELIAPDDTLNVVLGGDFTAPDYPDNNAHLSGFILEAVTSRNVLQPGDADMDLKFDQLDLVKVQIAAKYLTGQAATWGDGDWDGGPGGEPGNPPPGDGLFNQLDIIAALNAGKYLTGPYAALPGPGTKDDGQTSLVYNAGTGELSVDPAAGKSLTSVNIDSAGSRFVGSKPAELTGSFDNFGPGNIFKATFGGQFGAISFGNVLAAGLSEDVVRADLTVVGSLAGGGDLGAVDLVYIPEPASVLLLVMGLAGLVAAMRRR